MTESTEKSLSRYWVKEKTKAARTVSLANPASVLKFVTEIADAAERLGHHHPEIETVDEELTISITLHDPGGLTDRDVELAGEVDRIARAHFCS